MLGNMGNLFVKCTRQVTKGHLYHLLKPVCEMYATCDKMSFIPSSGGIGLLCDV